MDNKKNLLIGVTGSVASIKLNELIQIFKESFHIKVIVTEKSKKFVPQFTKINQKIEIYQDQMQWDQWNKRGDPVLHIQLRKWAHIFLISPLGANTLAKLSNGLCDNLLTLVARCWNFEKQNGIMKFPFFICPAMNTMMYNHPITSQQLKTLQKWGIKVIDCQSKVLMCGEEGNGAMAKIQQIKKIIMNFYQSKEKLQ